MNNCESLWLRDLKEIWKLKEWGRSFEDCFKWKVSSGNDISFWEDKWVGNVTLKSKFLRLYSLSVDKDIPLNLCGDRSNNVWRWNLIWRSGLFEWEKLQVCQLLEVMQGSSSVSTFGDRWTWQSGESLKAMLWLIVLFVAFVGQKRSLITTFFLCISSWLVWNLCLGWLGLVSVALQDSYSHLL